MTMKDTGCFGYVLKADDFFAVLLQVAQRTLDAGEMLGKVTAAKALAVAIQSGHANRDDCEELATVLQEIAPALDFPPPETCYMLGDEDSSDDLEHGIVYVIFDESSLWVKTPTPGMMQLAHREPEVAMWCAFG